MCSCTFIIIGYLKRANTIIVGQFKGSLSETKSAVPAAGVFFEAGLELIEVFGDDAIRISQDELFHLLFESNT